MFLPQSMTEIELIVPSKDLVDVTKVLSGRGGFHEVDSSYYSSETKVDSPNEWQEKAAAYSGLERRIQNIMQTLGIAEGNSPDGEFDKAIQIEVLGSAVEKMEQEVKKASEQLNNDYKEIEHLESIIRQLEPVADIDLDISELRNPHFLFSLLGTMPVANMDRLDTSLSRVPSVLLTLRQDNHNAVVWLGGMQNNADVLERAARSAYLNPLSLPETYQGTPAKIIKSLHKSIEDTRKDIEAQKLEITHLKKTHEKQLQEMLWDARSSRMLTDAIVRYGRSKYTYIIVGFAISSELEKLKRQIKKVSKETLIETYPTKRGGDNQNVPVSLKNPKILQPFQMLVTTYGRPRYGELDPTLLMGIMFPFLFGAMFGDVGQGIVLAFLGWLLASKKVKALRGMASLGGVIVACGLMATVFGFLYGSIFGFEEVLHAIWIRPVEKILDILMIAIIAGLILLSLGFLLGIFNAWKARDWPQLFFGHYGIAGLALYWSLLGLVASAFLPSFPVPTVVFTVVCIIAGLVVFFSEVLIHWMEGVKPLIEGGVGTYLVQAFFELFETVISLMSNSLSYVRVGAFAVAHGGLSMAFFLLADLISPHHGVGYWVTLVGGNIFIVGFEGLIVGIQTMRLSYYEFFGKFFTGGGIRFEPLSLRPDTKE